MSGSDDRRPLRTPLSGASGTSPAVRDAGSSVRAVAALLGLPAAAFPEETGGADPAGGVLRVRARPLAAAALEWASAVVLVIGHLTDLGAPTHLCCAVCGPLVIWDGPGAYRDSTRQLSRTWPYHSISWAPCGCRRVLAQSCTMGTWG
ncbi:hypothetical protein NDU88_003938 [Pleurodeles waltl]|uniref:Uncharacterized protein n=1 Tax=Pleurodeles waltl TaxID=8319 RepID=A0AAV7SHC1_PLEWA|nr:hypothetical protein NDU88_003938 [Pleurodeles waltl]